MKIRESGMPEESWWESFFDSAMILKQMQLTAACRDVVEFGCGYGTFTIPAARIISGRIFALDIEPEMIHITQAKAIREGLTNVVCAQRDFMHEGTGLPDHSLDYVMLFNILHAEQPEILLREAWRVLLPGGKLGIIHWNYDPSTPRGPSMAIRPRPEQCQAWAEMVGFQSRTKTFFDLPPYHFGLVFETPSFRRARRQEDP
ncbi:MAG: class I SAM-dependent methyltransferase [Candidatus Omnitrophica bacterium]|nr:class I SAM-dependent methyltransferase [Candidatus Omnitrophota bacterium]